MFVILAHQEAETRGSRVRGQPGLHSNTLSPKDKQKNFYFAATLHKKSAKLNYNEVMLLGL
jgi:hypothetical protein